MPLMEEQYNSLLDNINYPCDLRKLEVDSLPKVCEELRQFIIDEVSNNPGHFGASLGVIELTVALHYIYNTPKDKLIWDVGHQAYAHKILTGRKEQFHTNRKYNGISGFPKRAESEYDAFGVGHSSTSISAALGMAVAASLTKSKDEKVVAVIGDGAMTGGMAFEAMNNAAGNNSDILIILNDNNMAIDPNVGGINSYLLDIARSQTYNRLKKDIWDGLGKIYGLGKKTRRLMQLTENAIKQAILKQSNMFEALGIRYFGPVDGHDVVYLAKVLEDMKHIPGPKLLHVITQKGKGFTPAEENQTEWHAPGVFDKTTGKRIVEKETRPCPPRYQDVFGLTLVELADENEKIVGITPAMPTGCSLNYLMEKYPDRAFDVGIAEPHAVTFSAGLASNGIVPFCNIYSSFMQRAYDQVIHDVAIQKLPVIFCLDRGGLVGADGATHHGVFDIAFLRNIPNMIVSAPMDELELRNLMFTAQKVLPGPFAIRYPRGKGVTPEWKCKMEELPIGKGRTITEGQNLAFLTVGHIGNTIVKVNKMLEEHGLQAGHFDMRFIKPLDEDMVHHVLQNYQHIITVEDGVIQGGFGSLISEFMALHGYKNKLEIMGIPDRFVEQGTPSELYKECNLDRKSIFNKAMKILTKEFTA
ncbi:1-deoxy-D-xylulose-5-phosphate synthase [Puteibacter caeruleilacunae]|nr:1-deoxy-D-xylulose-5-phosphate synthase [Puteibacter caeruleilacunae]